LTIDTLPEPDYLGRMSAPIENAVKTWTETELEAAEGVA